MSMFSYLLTIWGIIFWIFRAIVAIMATNGTSFFIAPLNNTIEIILLFATIPCMVLVLKRNVIGAAAYMALYVSYFGTAVYNSLNGIADTETGLNITSSVDLAVSVVGIVIPVLTFLDIMLNKNRKSIIGGNKKTDWYYNTDKYDRQYDERADKNQYKIR